MSELTQLPAWQTLWDHFADAKQLHMRELFQNDPERAERYGLEVGGAVTRLLQEPHHR
jgi:glucose-6-phosphate isomerase